MPSYEGADKYAHQARFNTDDVFNRCVIVGLLNLMNNKIKYEQIWETNIVEIVELPVMYDFGSSDERFAQDNYTFFGQACFGNHKITGKFDMLPRCVLKYTGSSIDSASMTNRFVNGTFMRNENGKIVTYHSFLYSIPLKFEFDCEVFCDNIDSAFKIEQSIRETFYKNRTYNVVYKGMRLSCSVGFPEQVGIEKTVSYSFDAERALKLTFHLVVEAYQPAFDETTKIDAANRIEHIGYDVEHFPMSVKVENKAGIKLHPIDTSAVYTTGEELHISWDCSSNISDMPCLCLCYETEEGKTVLISGDENHREYWWTIPDTISDYKSPTITCIDNPGVYYMIKEPNVRVIPQKDGKITKESFRVIDGGKFVHNDDTITVPFTLDYVNQNGKVEFSDSYKFIVRNGEIDKESPVCVCGEPMVYKNDFSPKPITLKIFYPTDREVCDEISNILIL